MFWSFLGFGALLALTFFGLRWLSRRGSFSGKGRHLQVLDRLPVTRDSAIVLVRAGGRVFAVGAGKDNLNLLAELDAAEFVDGAPVRSDRESDAPEDAPKRGFFQRFLFNFGLLLGLKPKGTPPARPQCRDDAPVHPSFQEFLNRSQSAMQEPEAPAPQPSPTPSPAPAPPHDPTHTPADAEILPPTEVTVDYNSAIENMKRFGRMERPAPVPPSSPLPVSPASYASRAYSAAARPEAGAPVLPFDAGVSVSFTAASAPHTPPQRETDDLLERVSQRSQRLRDKLSKDDGKDPG